MTKYEQFLIYAEKLGLLVQERRMTAFEGLICGKTICIDNKLTETQKAAVLAEEIAHYCTSVGDILDMNDAGNHKQELKARRASYDLLINPDRLAEAERSGARTVYEVAEYLEVPEDILREYLKINK